MDWEIEESRLALKQLQREMEGDGLLPPSPASNVPMEMQVPEPEDAAEEGNEKGEGRIKWSRIR